MRYKVRLFIFPLILLSLVLCFSACAGGSGDSSEGVDTEVAAPEPQPKGISVSALAEYTVVRSRSADLSQKTTVTELKRKLKDVLGSELNICGDGEDPVALEILVGETNRPASEDFMNSLRYHDYGYAVVGDTVVIGGHSQEALNSAIEQFCTALTEASSEQDALLLEGEYVTRGTYPAEDMTVCGLSAKDLTVVYGTADKDFALLLAEAISDGSGYPVKAVSHRSQLPEQGNLLILGASGIRGLTAPETFGEAEICVKSSSDAVLLSGGVYGYEQLRNSLLANIMVGNGASVPLPEEASQGALLRVMSYNVLVSGRSAERTAALVESIRWTNPDTVGLQEANDAWMRDFATYLPEYAAVGVGRSASSAEGTYILYRKDKFTLLDSGTRWLSDTPEVESKYEESKYCRIYTYAVLKRNSDGKVFVHVNTHLDHTSDLARAKQGDVLLKELGRFEKYPAVITGDFNCTSSATVYSNILAAGYRDSASFSLVSKTEATFRSSGKVIDFCFVTPDKLTALNYRVFSQKVNDLYPSDHNAVYVDIVLNG